MIRPLKVRNFLVFVLLLTTAFYILRASTRSGDFVGYVNAGHATLAGQNIYNDYLNTWPPFFSVCCVPLSLLDDISGVFIRLIWLLLTVGSMFWLMRITVRWLHGDKLLFPFQKEKLHSITIENDLVFIPLLIIFRYLLENLANIQINVFLLLASIVTISLFIKGKAFLSGMILAFIISLKVFPVFLLMYFLFKREFKIVCWTFLFLLVFNIIPLLVYGFDQGVAYYIHWWNEITSKLELVQHKNQSFFSMLGSLMMAKSAGLDIYINLTDLSLVTFKKISYVIIFLGALYPMYLFRRKLTRKNDSFAYLEYVFVLTSIPILSPLAWKAYFIFLWPGYLFSYYYLFENERIKNLRIRRVMKLLFIISVLLTVFSTDLFLGAYLADLMEVFSSITIGTLLLMAVLIAIYKTEKENNKLGQYDLSQ